MKRDTAEVFGVPAERRERNWVPLGLAVAVVLVVVAVFVILSGPRKEVTSTPTNAATDPYAGNLPISNLTMSESSNLAGGKVTYIDGQIANHGDRVVTGIRVQVLFRNYAQEVAQNETIPLTLVRMREPYVDTEPVSAAPLKPGQTHDFRLNFDNVSPDWAGAVPEIRVLQVQTK
jgi:hypothetical protein